MHIRFLTSNTVHKTFSCTIKYVCRSTLAWSVAPCFSFIFLYLAKARAPAKKLVTRTRRISIQRVLRAIVALTVETRTAGLGLDCASLDSFFFIGLAN
jgi:hypothetical protein